MTLAPITPSKSMCWAATSMGCAASWWIKQSLFAGETGSGRCLRNFSAAITVSCIHSAQR